MNEKRIKRLRTCIIGILSITFLYYMLYITNTLWLYPFQKPESIFRDLFLFLLVIIVIVIFIILFFKFVITSGKLKWRDFVIPLLISFVLSLFNLIIENHIRTELLLFILLYPYFLSLLRLTKEYNSEEKLCRRNIVISITLFLCCLVVLFIIYCATFPDSASRLVGGSGSGIVGIFLFMFCILLYAFSLLSLLIIITYINQINKVKNFTISICAATILSIIFVVIHLFKIKILEPREFKYLIWSNIINHYIIVSTLLFISFSIVFIFKNELDKLKI